MPNADFVGKDATKMTTVDMLRYTMFDGSCTAGGGLCWACSPYAEGSVWQTGVVERMTELGEGLLRYGEGFYNARQSKSYPTVSGDTLEGRGYVFFMTSEDGEYEYMHLMKQEKMLTIPPSADGAEIYAPTSLCDGVEIQSFKESCEGYVLELSGELDEIDTVIRFRRRGGENAPKTITVNDADKRIRYEGEWKYCHLVGNKGEEGLLPHGSFESDYHRTESAGASLFLAFEGDAVEVYANMRGGNSTVGVYIDGIELDTVSTDSEKAKNRELIYSSCKLYGGWHTLYIVNKENKPFELDAVKIISCR